jgi:hypothetical protein
MSHTRDRPVEYRAYVRENGIDIESDEAMRLLNALEANARAMGPVLGGTSEGLEVVLASDTEGPGEAAAEACAAVAASLVGAGLKDLAPNGVEVEAAESGGLAAG